MSVSQPVPPEDVRVVLDDGREIPVELIYIGRDTDGTHQWVTVAPVGGRPVEIRVDMMPAQTRIMIDGEAPQ